MALNILSIGDGDTIGFTAENGNGAVRPPFPPPPFPPPAPKPSAVDDNVPYNPATYADLQKVRMEIVDEAIERINYDSYLSSKIAEISGHGGGGSVIVDDILSLSSVNPVQNRVITDTLVAMSGDIDELSGTTSRHTVELTSCVHKFGDETIAGVKTFEEELMLDRIRTSTPSGTVSVVISGDTVQVEKGQFLVDQGITMTRNGEPTNDIVSKGYHFKYMDCTHEAKDGCIDFYLADGLWSYDPLIALFNEVKAGTKTLEDGGGVFDSTWKCDWDGILEGTKSEFQYRTTGEDTFVNINPTMFLRNSSNYDLCLELVGLVGNKATCRIVNGVQTTMYAAVGKIGSVNHKKVMDGELAPYEGNSAAWTSNYIDGVNVDDPTDRDRVSDMYTLRFTLNNVGKSVIARNQCAFGQANQTTGYSTQAFGCENIVSGKWGGAFGFGLHQLAWGENVYGRFNKTPTQPRANGLMRYPVIIGCGLSANARRDGLKFDRNGDGIFDRQIRSKTLSDIGVQSLRKMFTGRTAINLFPSEEDAVAGTNEITTAIKFVKPTANSSNTMMVVPTEEGGLFWMQSFPLTNASGTVVRNGATFAVRCKLNPGSGTTKGATWATQEEFDAATFENPAFGNGKFYVTGTLGMFWSEDGKTWNQSATVPKGANELEHFHNTSLTHIYHLKYDDVDFFVTTLPNGDEVVTTAYNGDGSTKSGISLIKTDTGYAVKVGDVEKEVTFVGGKDWWRNFEHVFMLGNMISFDPSDEDGWIDGQLGDKNTFCSPFSSVGAFVPHAIGSGFMAGFRAYCTASTTGLLYSTVSLTNENKVVMKWNACTGDSSKVKGYACDNLACGTDAMGNAVVVCSPLQVNSAHPEWTQPLYAKNGETSFHLSNFPSSAYGTPFETSFVTNEGAVIAMCGTGEANGKGFFWTNYLNGDLTKWNRSNIKTHPWTTPTYLEELDVYTSAAYRQDQNILISRDGKFWVKSDVVANGFPPVEFGGKVIFCGRGGVANDLSYLTVTDIDETYNLGSGNGGALSEVTQITTPYNDKIVRAKVNEIIVALGGTIELIPEEFTDEDIVNKVNEIIVAYR